MFAITLIHHLFRRRLVLIWIGHILPFIILARAINSLHSLIFFVIAEQLGEVGILQETIWLSVEGFDAGTDTIEERYITGVRGKVLGCFRSDCLRVFNRVGEGEDMRVADWFAGFVHLTILCLTNILLSEDIYRRESL